MDKKQQITMEIEALKKTDLSEAEKSVKVIELARELGKFLLEESLKK